MSAWNLFTLFWTLSGRWAQFDYEGDALRSWMMYVLQGMRTIYNCDLAPYAFTFEGICQQYAGWLR